MNIPNSYSNWITIHDAFQCSLNGTETQEDNDLLSGFRSFDVPTRGRRDDQRSGKEILRNVIKPEHVRDKNE